MMDELGGKIMKEFATNRLKRPIETKNIQVFNR